MGVLNGCCVVFWRNCQSCYFPFYFDVTFGAKMTDKPFWETKLPKDHHTKHLSHKQQQNAKARARAAGRPYPNLIDNAAAARKKGK